MLFSLGQQFYRSTLYIYICLDHSLLLSWYCRILIHIYFHTVLSEKKNKYQIHSYATSNMDDFKMICIYENLHDFAYFLINGRIYLVSLKKKTFSNIIPRGKHVLNTLKSRTFCAHLYVFVVYISFAPVISESIHRNENYSDIKVLMMDTETETFNIDFTA